MKENKGIEWCVCVCARVCVFVCVSAHTRTQVSFKQDDPGRLV